MIPKNVSQEFETKSQFVPCGKCSGGYIPYQENGYTFYKECKCLERYKIEKALTEANIPKKYYLAKLDLNKDVFCQISYPEVTREENIEIKLSPEIDINKFGYKYIELQHNYFQNPDLLKSKSLLLCGPVASGKSKFACAVGIEFLKKNYNVYYIKMKQYIETMKRFGDKEKTELMKYLTCTNSSSMGNCELLIIDEMGFEYHKEESGFALSEIKDLLRTRAEKLYPTIITTNMTVQDIEKFYGEEIMSMLYEDYAILNVLYNYDYRAELGKRTFQEFDMKNLRK